MDFFSKDFDPDFEEPVTIPLLVKPISLASHNRHLKSRRVLLGSGHDQREDTFIVRKKAREGIHIKEGLFAGERVLEDLFAQAPAGHFFQVDDLSSSFDCRHPERQPSTLFGAVARSQGSAALATSVDGDYATLVFPELVGAAEAPRPVDRARMGPAFRKPRSYSLNSPTAGPTKSSDATRIRYANLISRIGFKEIEAQREPRRNKEGEAGVFLRSIVSLLLGFGSEIFVFDPTTSQFEARLDPLLSKQASQDLECSGQYRKASLLNLLQQFAQFGTVHKLLSDISGMYLECPHEFGILGASFGKALGSYLHTADITVISAFADVMPKHDVHSLLLVWNRLQATYEVLRALRGFFLEATEGSLLRERIPRREALLDGLYGFIQTHMTYPLSLPLCVLYSMYSQACIPYFVWISDVLCIPHKSRCSSFSSHLAPRDDPFGESFVGNPSQGQAGGFPKSLLDEALLQAMLESIRGLAILKEHCPNHPIFQEGAPSSPFLTLRFTGDGLSNSSESWKTHCRQMIEKIKHFSTNSLPSPLQSYVYAYQGCPKRFEVPIASIEHDPINYAVFSMPPMASLIGCEDENVQEVAQLIGTRDAFRSDQGNFDQISETLLDLGLIIETSVKARVHEQCQLVNKAVHLYLLECGGLRQHLKLLKDFLLLSYGPFSLSLGPLLADALQIDTHASPLSVISRLNASLAQAVSDHPVCRIYPDRKLFKLDFDLSRAPGDFFACLNLLFSPVSPIDNVINPDMLKTYGKVFQLLAKLHGISALISRHRPPRRSSRLVFLAFKAASHFIASLQAYMYDRVAGAHHRALEAAFVRDPFAEPCGAVDFSLSGIPLLVATQRKITKRMRLFALLDATLADAESCLAACIRSTLDIVSHLIRIYGCESAPLLTELQLLLERFRGEKAKLVVELRRAVDYHAFRGAGHSGSDLGSDNPFLLLILLIG